MKGLERFLGTVDNLEPQLMEATSGQAKYEHQHRAIVWRMPRLPKEGQGKSSQVPERYNGIGGRPFAAVFELTVRDRVKTGNRFFVKHKICYLQNGLVFNSTYG